MKLEMGGPGLGGEQGWLHSPGLSGHMPFEHLQHSWSAGHYGLQQEAKPHSAQVGNAQLRMLEVADLRPLLAGAQQCGVSCCDLRAVPITCCLHPSGLSGTTLLPTFHSSSGTQELKTGWEPCTVAYS